MATLKQARTDRPTYQHSETERAALRVVRRAVRALRDAGFSPLEADCGPEGDWAPVRTEREVHARLVRAGEILGIKLLDSLVVSADKWRAVQ